MSLLFTHHDHRTNVCDHDGTLGKPAPDGTRMCVRCGKTIKPEAERFTGPTRRELGRRATTTTVR